MPGRSIRFLRVLVISAMCLSLFPATVSANENAPVLVSLTIPPSIANAATPVQFTALATITDDNGVALGEFDPEIGLILGGPEIVFAAPRGSATAIGRFERVPLTTDDFSAVVTLPKFAAIGVWTAYVVAADLDYDNWLQADGYSIEVTGIAGTDDVTAPTLDAVSGPAPAIVDVGDCDYRNWVVQFDASITEGESGFDPNYSQFIFQSPSGFEQVPANGFEDRGGSVFRMTFNLYPGAETGTWTPYAADLTDVVGNTSNLTAFGAYPDAHFEVVSNPSSETVPGVVSNFTVDFAGDSASLDWDAPADDGGTAITGYVVMVGIDNTHGYVMPIEDPGVTSATIDLTEPGAAYAFSVAAGNRCGQGESVASPTFAAIPDGGGTVGTDLTDPTDPEAPFITAEISVPAGVGGGTVTISATEPDLAVPGWEFVGQQLVITSTAATTAANPLSLVFRVPNELTPVTIFRNGVAIATPCAGDGTTLPVSPCVAGTAIVGDEGEFTEITILSTSASTWNVGQRTLQQYDFRGFLGDVGNPPIVNRVKAGDTVRVQFSLAGDQGMDIIEAGYPTFAAHACGASGGTEVSVTAGKKGLTYDARKDAYSFWWSTSAEWKKTCGTFILKLDDGTFHTAEFVFN